MKILIFACCFSVAAVSNAQSVLVGSAPASAAPAATGVTVATPTISLTWEHTPWELYDDGGKKFEYEGRKYSLKMGFRRGAYEAFVKTYKTLPVFILTDTTDGPENFLVWNAGLADSDEPFLISVPGNKFYSVLLKQNVVTVFRHKNRKALGKKIVSFPYKELKLLWAENAARYKASYNGKPLYFVPQAFYNASGCNSVGYVVSMVEPYSPDTGLPLDFVELYRYTKASTDRKQLAYSIPMGIRFARSNMDQWLVSDFEASSLYDALDEEAERPEDCNKALSEAIKSAKSEK